MRVPADQLVAYFVHDGVDVEPPGFLCKLGMKNDVEKDVAQFFGKSVKIAVLDSLEHFIDFLDQHRLEGVEVLLLVPRASIRTSQRRHDLNEPLEFLLNGHESIIWAV